MYSEMSFTISVGAFNRRAVRTFLEQTHFNYPEIQFIESKGLLSSEFMVKGPETAVQQVYKYMQMQVRQQGFPV
jgi:hypothetical protein